MTGSRTLTDRGAHRAHTLVLSALLVLGSGCGSTEPGDAAAGDGAGGGAGSDGRTGDGAGDGSDSPGDGAEADGDDPRDGAGGSDGATGGDGLPLPEFAPGELDAPSMGATITMQQIGAPGWYPSRRDPASGACDAVSNGACCMTRHELTDDKLSPWNEELIMTLRGPMLVKQFAAYQPDGASFRRVSSWDERAGASGLRFSGNNAEAGFPGSVGTECLVDLSPDEVFPCGAGSEPFCPSDAPEQNYGWSGTKLFVLLAAMPHMGDPGYEGVAHCSDGPGGNWYDAPWIGLSHGELVRSGKFGGCHCYAKNPDEWYLADGCGQFNVFEVVNDNNQYANLDLFSTNLFAYHGYVGEGPCGQNCNVSNLPSAVDLVDKSNSRAAAQGAITTPSRGPGAAFRRPTQGYRYFVMLLDVDARTIQLGLVHPEAIPAALSGVLPTLPARIDASAVAALRDLRLPR